MPKTNKLAMKLAKRNARHARQAQSSQPVAATMPQSKPATSTSTTTTTSTSKAKTATLSIAKVAIVLIAQLPLRAAYPIMSATGHKEPPVATGSDFWVNMSISVFLVLMGGIFAGLTLGLMGQDEVYLQVIQQTGEESERKAAAKVLSLLNRGKHWVLVTLLLSNVITNESLPIVLDRCLGGGWPAVVSSTVAIVIFGEIIPQSASVRYGLGIGAAFAPFVLGLMYIMYPVAYPVALLLDYILGEDHGTVYKRAGLKSLVGLHKTMGVERLSDDEVTIITAVLDLKDKPVHKVMTPISDVFTMPSDRILDEATIEEILHTGFNRIPIHVPNEPSNFIGMLLVRTLITYDPEDGFPIYSFPLATLPETKPDTSCLNILNYFQEGKSHMVVVSLTPGESSGALGVLTLEDVIEELIGEEIIDESDVYVDVHKAIKRVQPGPLKRIAHSSFAPRSNRGFENVYHALAAQDGSSQNHTHDRSSGSPLGANKPKLNPLNRASNPLSTLNSKVTIKPAVDGSRISLAAHPAQAPASARQSHYGSIHVTEQDAVDSAAVLKNSYEQSTGKYLDIAPAAGTRTNGDGTDGTSPELHSYRTGYIVESVVNVQGVAKTIIEDTASSVAAAGGNPNGVASSVSSRSWHANGSSNDDDAGDENQPLLK